MPWSAASSGLTHDIIANKKYKSIEELRGATFGSSSLTSGTVTALKQALKAKGLEYPRDYKILIIAGGSSANLAAMQSGQIAATTWRFRSTISRRRQGSTSSAG